MNYPPQLTPVRSGERLRARTINDIQDAIRRRASSERDLYPALDVARPWDMLAWNGDTMTLTLRQGYVEVATDAGTLYLGSSTAADPECVLVDGENWVYLTVTGPAASATYTLARAATLAAVDSTATSYVKLLWRVTVSTYYIIDQVRYCDSNPEPPAWRPEP
jgi:hypothetical protein